MKNIRFILKFIKYYLSAKSIRKIHSPFVFDLCEKVIFNNSSCLKNDYILVESVRRKLRRNKKLIDVTDYGAGTANLFYKKSIAVIAKDYAKSSKYGQLLYRLIDNFRPESILELGTSLGISTIYQALARESKIITIEGCTQTASVAQENFKELDLQNIELIVGNFDEILPHILKQIKQLDYVFFDGNHRKETTIDYFEKCLLLAHKHSLFVFDDIHWSNGMEEAWRYIKTHPRVTVTIDLFFMGLVFFRKEQVKQDFVIRF